MKNQFILFVFLATAFCSCRYQYFRMASDLPEQEAGGFVFENDTIKLEFQFVSKSQMNLILRNKIDEIVYLDLARSALIVRGNSTSLFSGGVGFSGYTSTNSNQFKGMVNSVPERLYVPPKSQAAHTIKLNHIDFRKELVTSKDFEKINFGTSTTSKSFKFDQADSLDHFETFLFVGNGQEEKPLIVQNQFWTKQIIMSGLGEMPVNHSEFVDSQLTGAGTAVITTAIIGGIVVVAIYAPDELFADEEDE